MANVKGKSHFGTCCAISVSNRPIKMQFPNAHTPTHTHVCAYIDVCVCEHHLLMSALNRWILCKCWSHLQRVLTDSSSFVRFFPTISARFLSWIFTISSKCKQADFVLSCCCCCCCPTRRLWICHLLSTAKRITHKSQLYLYHRPRFAQYASRIRTVGPPAVTMLLALLNFIKIESAASLISKHLSTHINTRTTDPIVA